MKLTKSGRDVLRVPVTYTNGIKLSGKGLLVPEEGIRATLVARPQARFSRGHARPEARQDPYLNAIAVRPENSVRGLRGE